MKSHLREWGAEMFAHFREGPARAPLYFVFSLYLTIWYAVTSRYPFGRNIFDEDWDMLIVLDACRCDTLREVANEYDYIEDIESEWSVGSQSAEWLANTFTDEYRSQIQDTIYLSSNGYSEAVLEDGARPPANNTTPFDFSTWSVVSGHEFKSHERIWERHHDETYGVVLPKTMSDYAIRASRDDDAERIIVHYTQPHLPYAGRAFKDGREMTHIEERGYELLETGEASRDAVYDVYRETLRWVLDDVHELLRNVDAEKVVITADHGEAFGEGKAYGHPEGFPHPIIRKVPWVETKATDEHTRDPDIDIDSSIETDIEDHLRDLGYR